jgi:hypothetical protein
VSSSSTLTFVTAVCFFFCFLLCFCCCLANCCSAFSVTCISAWYAENATNSCSSYWTIHNNTQLMYIANSISQTLLKSLSTCTSMNPIHLLLLLLPFRTQCVKDITMAIWAFTFNHIALGIILPYHLAIVATVVQHRCFSVLYQHQNSEIVLDFHLHYHLDHHLNKVQIVTLADLYWSDSMQSH